MIERPERHVQAFADAGADGITLHVEATPHVHYALAAVREAGCRAGVALNPGTPPEAVAAVAADVDLVLCMTVNPGWGGQSFLEASPARIERLRALVGPGRVIEVDGGIAAETAARCAEAGATLFVAGSAVFGAGDPAAAVREIAAAAVQPGHSRGTCHTSWYGQPYRRSLRPQPHCRHVGPRVLIVDDHPSFRASARVLLEAEGFDVVGEAADGAQAITEAGRLRPEVVLLDVQLPDIDGFDVAARLTGRRRRPDRDPRLQPRRVGLRPARDPLRSPRLRAESRALRRPRPRAAALTAARPLGSPLMSQLACRGRR